MARYRKIDPRIWNDKKFRSLNDDGKLAFLFLLTHPHMTSLGAMRATVAGLAEEIGWPSKRMADAISDAMSHGMVVANRDASFVGLPNFLRYNEPEGPNSVTKAWIEALDLIPECREKSAVIVRCRSYLDAKSDAFRHAIGDGIWDAFAMPCPIQEQEQEQEQEQDSELRPTDVVELKLDGGGQQPPKISGKAVLDESVTRVFEHWRQVHGHPRAQLDEKRRKLIRKSLDGYTEADLCQAISGYLNSPHHMGENDRNTRFDDLDLLLRDAKHIDAGLRFHAQPPRTDLSEKSRRIVRQTEDWQPPEIRAAG